MRAFRIITMLCLCLFSISLIYVNILNNEEHIKSLDDRGTTLKYCRDLWFKELRQEFNHYTDEVFDRYYEEALRNVDDLDAIYLEMIRLELFVETVKSTI